MAYIKFKDKTLRKFVKVLYHLIQAALLLASYLIGRNHI